MRSEGLKKYRFIVYFLLIISNCIPKTNELDETIYGFPNRIYYSFWVRGNTHPNHSWFVNNLINNFLLFLVIVISMETIIFLISKYRKI
jgi:hypothetical protein